MINLTEYRMYNCQYRAQRDDSGKMTIGGTAALYDVYADMGWYLEVIRQGFFSSDTRTDRCVCLKNHDRSLILGRTSNQTLTLSMTAAGLDYEANLPDTTQARDAYNEVEGKYITQSSFAFIPAKVAWVTMDRSLLEGKVAAEVLDRHSYEGKIEVREMLLCREVLDVSPVTWPAYEETSVMKRDAQSVREEYERMKPKPKPDKSLELRIRLAERSMNFWKNVG